MKRFSLLILLVLITACRSSKKAIEKTEKIKKIEKTDSGTIQKVEQNSTEKKTKNAVMIDELLKPKKNIESDTLKNKKSDENPDLGFHQELKKTFKSTDDFWTNLLQKHVSDNGKVNYKIFKKDYKGLQIYIESIQAFIPKENATKEEKLTYWINAYNALTIDLILRNYPVKSIKDIKDSWDQRLWKFGDKWLNLNHIEHNILRKMDEPRIHFAIVCASFSCPKLQNTAFTANNLEAQLTDATKEFLADSDRNEISQNNLKLSKIFKWFAKDFKTDGNLIDFLNKYTEVEISSKAKRSFKDYNWDLND